MAKFVYDDKKAFDSDVLVRGWYNETYHEMVLEFHNGSTRGYSEVGSLIWNGLVTADSAGRYYNSRIKSRFKTFDSSGLTFESAKQPGDNDNGTLREYEVEAVLGYKSKIKVFAVSPEDAVEVACAKANVVDVISVSWKEKKNVSL